MFDKIRAWMREVKDKMFPKQVKEILSAEIAVSEKMAEKIELWFKIFENKPPWLDEKTKSLNLAVFSTAYLARLVNAELKLEVTGDARGKYLNDMVQKYLVPKSTLITQLAEVGGQVILRPVVTGKDIAVEIVRSNCFYPIAFDVTGRAVDAAFMEQRKVGRDTYVRVERHTFKETDYKVTNTAFEEKNGILGRKVPLKTVEAWAGLESDVTIEQVERPLFACYKMPYANNLDLDSPLPIGMYANAVDTLEKIDNLYSDYHWEFKSARRKLFISDEAYTRKDDGDPGVPDDDLFLALDFGANFTDPIHDHSPEIREQSYQNGINQFLRMYEAQTGVAAGTFSLDIRTGNITATEIISEDRATYYTVSDIQRGAKAAYNDLIYAMDVYATLYNLAPAGRYEVIAEFGDSVFEDTNTEFTRRMQMMAAGIYNPYEMRMWYFGEDEKTARNNLPAMTELLDNA